MAGMLRHGLSCLWPSEIADQYSCEYKLHLKHLHPEVSISLPVLEMGQAQHTALASEAAPITPAEIKRAIGAGKRLAMCEWVLEGWFDGIRIRGRPDVFTFEASKALLVLDFKFSRATRRFGDEPFRGQQVQAATYAVLAESQGFATEELCFGIVALPGTPVASSLREPAPTKLVALQALKAHGTLHEVHEASESARRALVASGGKKTAVQLATGNVFLYRYDRRGAARDLRRALGYWRSEREPVPEGRYPRKCVACPLNAVGLCEHALDGPDPGFKVERRQDGRVFVSR